MTIRILREPVIRPEPVSTPQCSMVVYTAGHDAAWRERWYGQRRPGADPKRCQHDSNVTIDGKPYCRRHAGALALERWLKGDLVEKST